MAGHARERRPGVWELRAYAGRDPLTGAKRWATKTVRAAGRKAAQVEADAFALTISGKGAGAPARVGELLERWFEARSPDWSPGTCPYVSRITTSKSVARRWANAHDNDAVNDGREA